MRCCVVDGAVFVSAVDVVVAGDAKNWDCCVAGILAASSRRVRLVRLVRRDF